MRAEPYTLAQWRVEAGREDEFVALWERLVARFAELPSPPLWGTLLRSETERTLFYSFGPWQARADIQAMRESPEVQALFEKLRGVCREMTPGTYEVVRHVNVPQRRGT